MKALSTITQSTNGHGSLLPTLFQGKVSVLGEAFVLDLLPITSDNTGNTRWEATQYFEVDSRNEGIKLLRSFAAKFDGDLLDTGDVHKSAITEKVGKGGTAYTKGGNDTVTHTLGREIDIAGMAYKVTANATLMERSRDKVKYLCVTVGFKVQRVGSLTNGPKTKGSITPVKDF